MIIDHIYLHMCSEMCWAAAMSDLMPIGGVAKFGTVGAIDRRGFQLGSFNHPLTDKLFQEALLLNH